MARKTRNSGKQTNIKVDTQLKKNGKIVTPQKKKKHKIKK